MTEAEPAYRLVVFDELEDPKPVRDLFVEVTGCHPTDAAQWVARVPGVWPKPLDELSTRILLDRLFELEVAAEAWRVDKFPELGAPRTIHAASCEDGGLRILGLRGEPAHWVPWDKIDLISAGLIDADDEFRDVAPPTWLQALNSGARLILGRNPSSRRRRAMRIPRDPMPELFIVRREPLVTFRVVAGAMNYAYLGDRLKPSSAENFPLFLNDLCLKARDAYLTQPTKHMVDQEIGDDDVFDNSQALLDYTHHRLLWSWYRRDGEKKWAKD